MSIVDTFLDFARYSSGETITFHPERCLNDRFRAVDCARCADSCPAPDAITVTDGKPALNNTACLQCGLCLHHCPTEAFTQPDSLPNKLVKSVAALPSGSVDLICPQHPNPDLGPALHAVQTRRCLAAQSPVTLLELSGLGREIWLDDMHCSECPLGKVHAALKQTVAEANGWADMLENSKPISLGTEAPDRPALEQRPVHPADRPLHARRALLGSLTHMGQEIAAAEERVAMVKAGKSVPVSERLPQSVPRQRAKILAILNQNSSSTDYKSSKVNPKSLLPIANVEIEPNRCTACGLCARFCPTGAMTYLNDNNQFAVRFRPTLCLGEACRICEAACPENVLSLTPATISPELLNDRPRYLAAGALTSCSKCGQAIAQGPNLSKTCFACRPKETKLTLFS